MHSAWLLVRNRRFPFELMNIFFRYTLFLLYSIFFMFCIILSGSRSSHFGCSYIYYRSGIFRVPHYTLLSRDGAGRFVNRMWSLNS